MDNKLVDTSQIINGLAVLLSFFVGYKYALKRHDLDSKDGSSKGTDDDMSEGARATVPLNRFDNYKMVLVVRNDLKMGKGKIAAQCGHGAVGAYQKAMRSNARLVSFWENQGCAKIALKVESEPEIMAIKRAAEAQGLVTCLIRDAGRTQIEPGSKTVLAIGPAAASDIDRITGHLKLL